MTYREAMAYLLRNGNLRVPCSRYGTDTKSCAPIVWRAIQAAHRGGREQVTPGRLDRYMEYVVNDHPSIGHVAYRME